jgi:prevent-host-death family protein
MPDSSAELPVSVARERFADIVNNAAYRDEITYVTRHGKRVAVVAPVSALEAWLEDHAHGRVPRRGTGAALDEVMRKHTAAHGVGDSAWAEEHEHARQSELVEESVWDEG